MFDYFVTSVCSNMCVENTFQIMHKFYFRIYEDEKSDYNTEENVSIIEDEVMIDPGTNADVR